jgi:hypothetical protein
MTTSEILKSSVSSCVQADVQENYDTNIATPNKICEDVQFIFHLEYSWTLNVQHISPLMPNGHYAGRTAPLTSRRCILNIYSTNICTEYFKHSA